MCCEHPHPRGKLCACTPTPTSTVRPSVSLAPPRRYSFRALRVQGELLGPQHPDLAATYTAIGEIYFYGKQDAATALEYHNEALTVFTATVGPDAPEMGETVAYLSVGARRSFRWLLLIPPPPSHTHFRPRARPPPPLLTGAIILHMLSFCTSLPKAMPMLNFLLLVWVALSVKGRCFTNLGNAAHATGDLDQALRYLLRGLRVYQQTYGQNHPAVAVSQTNLANVYTSKGNTEQAEQCLQRATAIHAYLAPTMNVNPDR